MKKTNLLFFSILFLNIHAFASFSIDWMKMPDILTNTGTAIARDANDNVYTTTSTGSIYLEKRDRFGNFKWQVNSFTTVQFNYEYPVQIHIDPQGNPVVVGYRHTISSDGHNANAIIILKYDPNGTLMYKKIIQGSYSIFMSSQYWTKVTSRMDAAGCLYIATGGTVGNNPSQGFNIIKIDPNGNTIRVSTKNFPAGTNFHLISQIRLDGNKVGVTGVTSSPTANATTWVIDTAGVDLWSNISAGLQGKDLAFDAAGNVFMLTWISLSSYGDISLYKFDNAGMQIWNHQYDFGGSDLAARMEKTTDGNLAILAYGNQAPSVSYYVDWITFKVDTSGNQLWFDRYDEHSGNDETPGMMAVDNNNNIYVTGIGGPFPGGFNLSKRQMVTVKYDSAGNREWTSVIDTLNEYMTGIAMTLASDNSLFVLGDVKTFIVHYLDHIGNDPCTVPLNVTAAGVSNSTAVISWNAVPNASLYHVQYKTAASAAWLQLSTDSLTVTLTSLFAGTIYEYRVEAICNSGPTGFSAGQQFTTSGNGYCPSMGLDASHEWIDLVYLETLLNSTIDTDSGYADFTNLAATLIKGSTYDITLSAGMDAAVYTEFWRVWIDFNQNGDFTDAGEEVAAYSSSQIGWETSTFIVPNTALTGPTIMRVSMKNGASAQTPCEIFSQGEVEDYTVIINSINNVSPNENTKSYFSFYPNPASETLNIRFNKLNEQSSLKIIDLSGRTIISTRNIDNNNLIIDIHDLTAGIYFLAASNESGNISVEKWIKN